MPKNFCFKGFFQLICFDLKNDNFIPQQVQRGQQLTSIELIIVHNGGKMVGY